MALSPPKFEPSSKIKLTNSRVKSNQRTKLSRIFENNLMKWRWRTSQSLSLHQVLKSRKPARLPNLFKALHRWRHLPSHHWEENQHLVVLSPRRSKSRLRRNRRLLLRREIPFRFRKRSFRLTSDLSGYVTLLQTYVHACWSSIQRFFPQDAFYLTIRVLWGMTEKGAVPAAPDRKTLKEFYAWFNNTEDIE